MKNKIIQVSLFCAILFSFSHLFSVGELTIYSITEQNPIPSISINIIFDYIEKASNWSYLRSKGLTFFKPDIAHEYLITFNGIASNLSDSANRLSIKTVVNNKVNQVYDIDLAPREVKEFSYSNTIFLEGGDRLQFQMQPTNLLAKLSVQEQDRPNSSLRKGESILVTIKPTTAPSLRSFSLQTIAKQIKSKKLTLEKALQILPTDLHQELQNLL